MNAVISVVIPTYGRPNGLVNTINSVLAQTYRDFEIIVVDDNSPDSPARAETVDLMKKYADDSRITYICHEKNKNGAAARNTGIKSAKGELIAFLDDDDIYCPNKLKTQKDFLDKNPEYGGVYGWHKKSGIDYKPVSQGDLTQKLLMCEAMAPTSTLMLRKDKLLEIGGFDEGYRRHQDIEMLIRFCKNNKIAPIHEFVTENGYSGDMNNLHCKDLENLKDNFLKNFSKEIQKQPKEIQKKIYCKNYAAVWADYLHRKKLGDSARIYFKWALKYPVCFTRECLKRVFKHLSVMSALKEQKKGSE